VPKDLSHIKCFKCDQFGHYSTSKDCPEHPSKKKDQEGQATGTWGTWEEQFEAGMFVTSGERTYENGSVFMTQGLSTAEVLLDNQANISIVNPCLLKNVRDTKHQGKLAKKVKEEKKKQAQQLAAAMATAGETPGSGKAANNETGKVPKDLSHIKCFKCDQFGHYSTSKKKDQEGQATGTWGTWEEQFEAGMFVTSGEHTYENGLVFMTQGLLTTEVLLDNQANISIMNLRLLKNVRDAKHRVRVKGIGGVQLIVDQVGDLEGFFEVYASSHTKANVLSFADVEHKYVVTYKEKESFTVQLECGKMVKFARKNKLYVANWRDTGLHVCVTVRENEAVYTKEEVRKAQQVYELVRTSGYPSPNKVLHLIHDGMM
jgi:hypothetical protein